MSAQGRGSDSDSEEDGNLIDDKTSPANRVRIATTLPLLADYFAGKELPHRVLSLFLTLATGADNEESEEAFLNKHKIFNEEGKTIDFSAKLSRKIRAAIELHIDSSPYYSEAQKVVAKGKLDPEKWNGDFMRKFRHCRYFWFICAGDKARTLAIHGEEADVPVSDGRSWFYLAIKERCDGKNTFDAMKSYVNKFKYHDHKDRLGLSGDREGDRFLTLKVLNAESAAATTKQKRADKKRKHEEELAAAKARDEAARKAALDALANKDGQQKPAGDAGGAKDGDPKPAPVTTDEELLSLLPLKPSDASLNPNLTVHFARDAHFVLYNDVTGKTKFGSFIDDQKPGKLRSSLSYVCYDDRHIGPSPPAFALSLSPPHPITSDRP